MKILVFRLSMPNVGSWNNKWTSEGKCFVRKKRVSDEVVKKIMCDSESVSFRYDFGDGWCASVSVEKMLARDANKLVKKSVGFCGYDWMIDSIIDKQEISL